MAISALIIREGRISRWFSRLHITYSLLFLSDKQGLSAAVQEWRNSAELLRLIEVLHNVCCLSYSVLCTFLSSHLNLISALIKTGLVVDELHVPDCNVTNTTQVGVL